MTKLSEFTKQEIRTNVINVMFPLLNGNEATIIFNYLIELIELVFIKNNIPESHLKYLSNEKYKDAISLLFLLFPYVSVGEKTTKNIRELNELYITFSKYNNPDKDIKPRQVNKYEPKFMFSNIQYNRINRDVSNMNKENPDFLNFDIKHLEQNFMLLKETIISTANKFYINWTNVYPIPYDINYFKKMTLYESTKEAITTRTVMDYADYTDISNTLIAKQSELDYEEKKTINNIFNYSGLQINDLYGSIRYNLYEQVYDIKWLIYDVVTKSNEKYNSTRMIISLLDEKLNLKTIKEGIKFTQITNSERQTFVDSWNNFNNELKRGGSIVDKNIMRYFTKFFNTATYYDDRFKNLGYRRIDKKKYKQFSKTKEITDAEYGLLLQSFDTIKPEWAYDFIFNTITQFKKTWYGKKIMDDNNKNDKIKYPSAYVKFTVDDKVNNITREARVTYKNIYNFAKSLVSFTTVNKKETDPDKRTKYTQYPKLWKALNKEDKMIILNRLNWDADKDLITQWFNITSNLLITNNFKKNDPGLLELNKRIHTEIIENLTTIIFEIMSLNGLLSQFKLDLTYNSSDDIKTNLANNKNIVDNSYYYITNKLYNDHLIEYLNNRDQYQKDPYLTFMLSPSGLVNPGFWNTIYALNWVSQLSFYHRYLNNRVIYVTGGTGVGKSTQVPKLLLYSLKMLDYNYQGKIMCTQPRIPPTKGNADTISAQLGVPIFRYDPILNNRVSSKNYYVQYKYALKNSETVHINKTNDLTLTLVTDGLLYEIIKNNPILKKQIPYEIVNDEKQKANPGSILYDATGVNELDIIIVDEAHEHNANMDMILTCMKTAAYYNNSLKLVIISATMESDEPRYRRYYRDINDNRMYPFNTSLEENNLDRINVDRRLHIWPPSLPDTTPYDIVDIWDKDPSFEGIVNLALKLIDTTPGDILLFQPGINEIHKMVNALNEKLPTNAIAIPYHGKMSTDKKKLIEGLSEDDKRRFIYPKDVQYDSLEVPQVFVPQGTYDRVIVVATNLAEASITINTLKSVIETGTQKTDVYDYVNKTSKIKLTSISESSRVQRRGRVGRKSPGTVYYTYGESQMKNNRIIYNIATENITPLLYDLLKDEDDKIPIIKPSLDPNNPSKFKSIERLINSDRVTTEYPGNLDKIIMKQYGYLTKSGYKFITYQGSTEQYDYENNKAMPSVYKSGFTMATINDYIGTFYLIHLNELDFQRDIFGRIVKALNDEIIVDANKKVIIKSKKIELGWNSLVETNTLFMKKEINKDGEEVLTIQRTKYGALFNFLYKTIRLEGVENFNTIDNVSTIIYGLIFGTLNDVIKILPLLMLSDFNISNLAENPKNVLQTLYRYKNSYGDLIGIRNLCDDILKHFNLNKLLKLDATNDNSDTILYYKQMVLSGNTQKLSISLAEQNHKSLINKLLALQSQGRLYNDPTVLTDEEHKLTRHGSLTDLFRMYYNSNLESTKVFCNVNNLNCTLIRKYMNLYLELYENINKYIIGDITKTVSSDEIFLDNKSKYIIQDIKEQIIKNRQVNNIPNYENNLIKTFLAGYPYRVFKYIGTCDKQILTFTNQHKGYISVFNFEQRVYNLPIVRINNNNYGLSFLDSLQTGNYILALNVSAIDGTINIINNISPEMIQDTIIFTYLPKFVEQRYNQNVKKAEIKLTENNALTCNPNNYYEAARTVKDDLYKKFSTKPYYLMMQINNDPNFKELLVNYINDQKNYTVTKYN